MVNNKYDNYFNEKFIRYNINNKILPFIYKRINQLASKYTNYEDKHKFKYIIYKTILYNTYYNKGIPCRYKLKDKSLALTAMNLQNMRVNAPFLVFSSYLPYDFKKNSTCMKAYFNSLLSTISFKLSNVGVKRNGMLAIRLEGIKLIEDICENYKGKI